MKTTLELPDDLMRAIKIRAASEDRKLKDLVAELLRQGLANDGPAPAAIRHRVEFPFFRGGHAARPEEEMTPERISELLLDEEARWALANDQRPL